MQRDVIAIQEVVLEMNGHHLCVLVDLRLIRHALPVVTDNLPAVPGYLSGASPFLSLLLFLSR